jgi:hypothetical protein
MASFLPFRPCVPADPRVFRAGGLTYGSPYLSHLSHSSTPPKRLSLPLAAPESLSPVDPEPAPKHLA